MDSPVTILNDWIVGRLQNGFESFVFSYIEALPVILGVSVGVYVLCSMVSRTLGKLGVLLTFLYGGFIILA